MTETKQRRYLKRNARFQARRVVLVGVHHHFEPEDKTDMSVIRHHIFNRNQAKRFLRRHPATTTDEMRFE